MMLLLLAIACSTDAPAPDVTVRETRGVYTVSAQFTVPQPPAAAFAVLTDYERITDYMPNIDKSVVRERSAGRAVIEQEAVSHFMLFSRRISLILDIVEQPLLLQFRDRSAQSFARYEGAWRLVPCGDGTTIVYDLTAQPSFEVPGFILKRVLKRDSAQMVEGLRQEIALRGGDVVGAAWRPGRFRPKPGSLVRRPERGWLAMPEPCD